MPRSPRPAAPSTPADGPRSERRRPFAELRGRPFKPHNPDPTHGGQAGIQNGGDPKKGAGILTLNPGPTSGGTADDGFPLIQPGSNNSTFHPLFKKLILV